MKVNIDHDKEVNICDHFDLCGGCKNLDSPYEKQIYKKTKKVKKYFKEIGIKDFPLSKVVKSPKIFEYRNNMELSFGDLDMEGKLELGMHLRGEQYDVVTIDGCYLIDSDFRKIIKTMVYYFRNTDLKKYNIKLKEGYLRHLKIRKGLNTGEILVNLITTSQRNPDLNDLVEFLKNIEYKGKLVGFLHTINDDYADAVKIGDLKTYYGRNYFYEKLFDFKFKISSLSFFQVNTKAAERLYEIVTDHFQDDQEKEIYDLYSGTGSLSQIISPHVKKVTGIEIDESAVKHARENMELNDIENCKFIQGDVRKILEKEKKNVKKIVVNPPRPGLHSEVINSIVEISPEEIVYVSCNPKTQARDIQKIMYNGYHIEDVKLVDMFPHTPHIESVALITKN